MKKGKDGIKAMKKEINDTREMLYELIACSGGNVLSPEVVKLSQKLDRLIASFYIRCSVHKSEAAETRKQKAVSGT